MRLCAKFVVGALVAVAFAGSASAGFETYVIRDGNEGGTPGINDLGSGLTEFVIDEGSMKAGWGSNDINGFNIGHITNLSITRHDDITRFTTGSGPYVAPYFNIWVTNGTDYAVVANEPSNPAFYQSLLTANGDGSYSYDLSFDDLADKTVKVYETAGWNTGASWVHDAVGKASGLTFADLASFEIAAPSATYITDSSSIGSGAPDELGTDMAWGFNWVFGDTLSHYVSGDEGYVVSGASASAVVPVPAAAPLALLGMGIVGLVARRSRKKG